MIKLLLLSVGTNACYHTAKILKEKFSSEFYIVGADINNKYLVPTYQYLDAFYKVSYSSSPEYYKEVLDICAKEKINFLLPSLDTDQKLFYPENKDLINLGVVSLGSSVDTLPIYDNKATMNHFLDKIGLPIPKQYSFKECQTNKLYMVKPINGVGSIDAALRTIDDMKLLDISNFIIQERCMEPEVTMECFYLNGKISTICRERIATKAGVCIKARIFKNKVLEDMAINFVSHLKVPHIFNLQFMKNAQENFVITDVNLRTAGGMSLSYAAGWDEASALAKIMLNKEGVFDTLPDNIAEQYVVRVYHDIVTKKNKQIVAFDLDGTLLDSRKRHQIVLDDILKRYKIEIDVSGLVEFKRSGKNNIDFLISKGVDKKVAEDIQNEWISRIENTEYLELDMLYPETIDLLKIYSKENDLILVTARNNKTGLENQIDKFNLRQYFQKIFIVPSNKNTTVQKAKILKDQNVILMIGDTYSDALAAKKAGIEFRFHENGFHSETIVYKGA